MFRVKSELMPMLEHGAETALDPKSGMTSRSFMAVTG